MPKLYTVKALAELFEKDEETIRRWIKDGDVFPSAFKVKDGWYVPTGDVKRLMKQQIVAKVCGGEVGDVKVIVHNDKNPRRSSKGFVREW